MAAAEQNTGDRDGRGGPVCRRGFLKAASGTALTAAGVGAAPVPASPPATAARTRAVTSRIGDTMPSLTFDDPATQRRLGKLYASALTDVSERNTIAADPAVYDRAGLLTDPPGTLVRAGAGYPAPQRWTRDAAVNAWSAVSLLAPDIGRNTLWSVVDRGPDGLVVQQDNQWWDQVAWIVAARHHYQVTGDQDFLARAYETSVHTMKEREEHSFNGSYGLFRGPGFMNDGISGYPDPLSAVDVRSSFVLDHPHTADLLCLSTNCLYYGARSALAAMADALDRPVEAAAWRVAAERLRAAIDRQLWRPEAGTYAYLVHGGGPLAGRVDTSQEGAGLALAVLLGVAEERRARQILDGAHWQPHGIVNVWPHFARFGAGRPGRHNVMVWPMVHGLYGLAAAGAGRTEQFARAVETFADLVTGSGGDFYEVYDSVNGKVDGGWQSGASGRPEHFVSQPHQTWSATAYLRLVHEGLIGLEHSADTVRLRPCLPRRWGPVRLRGLRRQDLTLDIALTGAGNRVRSCTVDGRPSAPVLTATGTGRHTVELVLDGD
ncbi:MGH1-like glycoside hydrolase domain-containing protein [Streptomyces sp. NPDC000878]